MNTASAPCYFAGCPKIFFESQATKGLSELSSSDGGVTCHNPIEMAQYSFALTSASEAPATPPLENCYQICTEASSGKVVKVCCPPRGIDSLTASTFEDSSCMFVKSPTDSDTWSQHHFVVHGHS
jgi:hypothetical protein